MDPVIARRRITPIEFLAPALAIVLCAAVALSGVRGSDWPAHLFRIELYRETGISLWNANWYGGHYTIGYGILCPPLASWFGPLTVGIVSSIVATAFVAMLMHHRYGSGGAIAACWFAVGAAANLWIGRLPFALGLAVGLGALVAFQRRHTAIAVIAAFMTPLASPVAGVFLALAAGALVVDHVIRRRAGESVALRGPVGLCMASVLPVVLNTVLFPDPGVFPFRGAAFVGVLVASIGLVVALPRTERVARLAAGLLAVAAVPLFVVANPLGGNVTRVVALFVVPVLGAALWTTRRNLVIAAAIPMFAWMVMPVTSGSGDALSDPAAEPEYHEPVVDYITRAGGPVGRVEIPFTDGHWETAFVAPYVPLARGWERQVDMARNALLYEPDLTAAEYRAWLDVNAVRWVAVPEVDFDEGGVAEVGLITDGLPWLDLRYSNADWRVYEVRDAQPVVEALGMLVSETADAIVIDVDHPGTVVVRAWYMPFWCADGADACVAEGADGLLRVVVGEPGKVTLQPRFTLEPLVGVAADPCEEGSSLPADD